MTARGKPTRNVIIQQRKGTVYAIVCPELRPPDRPLHPRAGPGRLRAARVYPPRDRSISCLSGLLPAGSRLRRLLPAIPGRLLHPLLRPVPGQLLRPAAESVLSSLLLVLQLLPSRPAVPGTGVRLPGAGVPAEPDPVDGVTGGRNAQGRQGRRKRASLPDFLARQTSDRSASKKGKPGEHLPSEDLAFPARFLLVLIERAAQRARKFLARDRADVALAIHRRRFVALTHGLGIDQAASDYQRQYQKGSPRPLAHDSPLFSKGFDRWPTRASLRHCSKSFPILHDCPDAVGQCRRPTPARGQPPGLYWPRACVNFPRVEYTSSTGRCSRLHERSGATLRPGAWFRAEPSPLPRPCCSSRPRGPRRARCEGLAGR